MTNTENQLLVIFGASGDLTARKLVPAILNLYRDGHLPENYVVLGASRSAWSDKEFRKNVVLESKHLQGKFEETDKKFMKAFADRLFYHELSSAEDSDYSNLNKRITDLDSEHKTDGNFIFYLSVPPSAHEVISNNLHQQGLHKEDKGWRRLIVEKPFGYDLKTAKDLNATLQRYFKETQIYRIDHYLGKETVQNLMALRFANALFEPIWNAQSIDHVQITAAESLGVGTRGGYYDNSGAMRDMVQNHLLQILTLIAMEPPANLDADSIRDEKLKVLKAFYKYIYLL